MARYDYGLRGYRETAPRRRMGRPWHLQAGPEDPRDEVRGYGPGGPRSPGYYGGDYIPTRNRVTARYNRDYVYPGPERYPINYHPYGGDTDWRVGDYTRFERPYMTKGGSYTYRGGREMGWEREDEYEPGPYRRRLPRAYGGREWEDW
jgi:hypothetical protein